jgi:hypothetical protein
MCDGKEDFLPSLTLLLVLLLSLILTLLLFTFPLIDQGGIRKFGHSGEIAAVGAFFPCSSANRLRTEATEAPSRHQSQIQILAGSRSEHMHRSI